MIAVDKSVQVERRLRSIIARGKYAHASLLPTETELMAEFQIGRNTVRQALTALEADGLVIRRRGSGTYVNYPRDKTEIAILGNIYTSGSGGGFFQARILQELQACLGKTELRPVLYFGAGLTSEEFAASIKMLDPGVLDHTAGLVAIHDLQDFEPKLRELGVPTVGLAASVSTCRHRVILDHGRLLELGAETLRAHGAEAFAFVHFRFPDSYLTPGSVHHAINQQYQELGRHARVTYVPVASYPDARDAYAAFSRFLDTPGHPRHVFFADDCIFDVAAQVILERGLRVPKDLQFITCTSIGRSFHFPVPVTGIGFHPRRIADGLWRQLKTVIEKPDLPPSTVMIEPEFIPGHTLIPTSIKDDDMTRHPAPQHGDGTRGPVARPTHDRRF